MKKIINGKSYNTETAEEVASFWNGLCSGDFGSLSESLYRTKKGSWFIAGEGGPMTKYARHYGNMTSGGAELIPITAQQALKWLERHNENEAIEKFFGDEIEEA